MCDSSSQKNLSNPLHTPKKLTPIKQTLHKDWRATQALESSIMFVPLIKPKRSSVAQLRSFLTPLKYSPPPHPNKPVKSELLPRKKISSSIFTSKSSGTFAPLMSDNGWLVKMMTSHSCCMRL